MDSSQRTFWGVSTVTTRRGWTQTEMHLDTIKRAPKIPTSHRLTINDVEPSWSSGFFSYLNFEKTLRMRLNRLSKKSFVGFHRATSTSSLAVGRFAAKRGSHRSSRGRLVEKSRGWTEEEDSSPILFLGTTARPPFDRIPFVFGCLKCEVY